MEPIVVESNVAAVGFTDTNPQAVISAYQAWLADTSVKKEILNISFAAESNIFALIVTYETV